MIKLRTRIKNKNNTTPTQEYKEYDYQVVKQLSDFGVVIKSVLNDADNNNNNNNNNSNNNHRKCVSSIS